jgi:type IV secretory pathway VirB10-like protein
VKLLFHRRVCYSTSSISIFSHPALPTLTVSIMSDPIDNLLAQIQPSSNASAKPKQHSPMPSQPPASSPGSIDDLLAEMDGCPPRPTVQPAPTPQNPISVSQPTPPPAPRRDGAIDNLLADMKSTYQEQDRAEALKQQQQWQEEQRQQQAASRQKQAVLMKQAEEWLKNLDIRSGEGAWFEEFAAKYPSRVEAAIEYLGLDS